MSLLEIADLRAGYGHVNVLDDFGLTVRAGQIVAVIGANGAGKTTLIAHHLGPHPGTCGFDRIQRSGKLAQAATRDCATATFARAGGPRRARRSLSTRQSATRRLSPHDEVLAQVFGWFPILRERLWQPAGTLSGGEQQMLAISRRLLSQPQLLMVDELSLGLAPKIAFELLERLIDIRAKAPACSP